MLAKEINGGAGRGLGSSQWYHPGLFRGHPAFEMVASGTSCDHITPDGFSTHVPRNDMVDGQCIGLPAAILTGEIIASEDLLAGQFYDGAGAFDHPVQPDDGGQGKDFGNAVDDSSTIHHQCGFLGQDQIDCSVRRGDVDGLEISV